MRENLLLRAFAQNRSARNNELRLMFRSSVNRDEAAAEAVNNAVRDNQPWLFGEESNRTAEIEDMRVAWFRVFGKLDATQRAAT